MPASPFLGSFAEANCAPGGRSILLCFPDVALWKMEPRGMKGIYSCLVQGGLQVITPGRAEVGGPSRVVLGTLAEADSGLARDPAW